jgi:hypothetical protein
MFQDGYVTPAYRSPAYRQAGGPDRGQGTGPEPSMVQGRRARTIKIDRIFRLGLRLQARFVQGTTDDEQET